MVFRWVSHFCLRSWNVKTTKIISLENGMLDFAMTAWPQRREDLTLFMVFILVSFITLRMTMLQKRWPTVKMDQSRKLLVDTTIDLLHSIKTTKMSRNLCLTRLEHIQPMILHNRTRFSFIPPIRVGGVFLMVFLPVLSHAALGRNDHRECALHFISIWNQLQHHSVDEILTLSLAPSSNCVWVYVKRAPEMSTLLWLC